MKTPLFHLILGISCLSPCIAADKKPPVFARKVFGSVENLNIVKTAQTVTAYRLTLPEGSQNPETRDARKLADPKAYKEGSKTPIPAELLQDLRSILTDEKLNDRLGARGCEPVYGVRFVFSQGRAKVAVDLCFLCGILAVSRDGQMAGGEGFDPAWQKLANIAKALFPEDKEIQALEHLL